VTNETRHILSKTSVSNLLTRLQPEISRLQAHRAHLTTEFTRNASDLRRALHELEMSTIDLRAAENRRKLADDQLDKARMGVMGIDAVQVAT